MFDGMDRDEVDLRLRSSDINQGLIEKVRNTTDSLCCDYVYAPASELVKTGQWWLDRICGLETRKVHPTATRELKREAGRLALLVGCAQYDLQETSEAEKSRLVALSLGKDIGHTGLQSWAHEMLAWFELTQGEYARVLAASRVGIAVGPNETATPQLYAQQAKAWARIGNAKQAHACLEMGREALERLPPPEHPNDHFEIESEKYDFYRMDTLRVAGADLPAVAIAHRVVSANTGVDGQELGPMRLAEARITLAVAALRAGDFHGALSYGEQALSGDRKSLPSLLMVANDLVQEIHDRYPNDKRASTFLGHIEELMFTGPRI